MIASRVICGEPIEELLAREGQRMAVGLHVHCKESRPDASAGQGQSGRCFSNEPSIGTAPSRKFSAQSEISLVRREVGAASRSEADRAAQGSCVGR